MQDDDLKDNTIIQEMDADELLAEIQKVDPDYKVETNVVSIRPITTADNFKPITYDKFKEDKPKPIEYIFYPCLPTQGIAFIYAPSGLGKTLFSLNLAYAIAGGGEFLKYKCPQARRVLYIDGEMPHNQIYERLGVIEARQGKLDYEQNLSILTPDKVLPFRLPKMDNIHDQQVYTKVFQECNCEVIIFDNLSMLSSFDENKSSEWTIIQDWLLHLRAMGKTIIVIHHTGKNAFSYRGTSKMIDCCDTAISLQPVIEEDLESESNLAKKFNVVYQKARLFGGKDSLPFEASLEGGYWTYRSTEQTDLERVVEKLNAGMSQREIAKEMLTNQTKINRLIKKARNQCLTTK